jgi:biotin carboxylase
LATHEVFVVSYQHSADAELADEPTAVPAGGEARGKGYPAVAALATSVAECTCFAVHRGVTVLNSTVVAAAQQSTFLIEKGRPDRDATFGESEVSLGNGNLEFLFVSSEDLSNFEFHCRGLSI